MDPLLVEPLEARPEVCAAAPLERDLVGQVVGRVLAAASCTAASTWSTTTLSGRISAATSRSSAQNSASVAAGSEPEVSIMTAIVSMPSERIEGR